MMKPKTVEAFKKKGKPGVGNSKDFNVSRR